MTTAALEKLSRMSREDMLSNNIAVSSQLNSIVPNASYIGTPEDLTFISDITSVIVSEVSL